MLPRVHVVLPDDETCRAVAPTGVFHALNIHEQREANEDGGDIFTGEELPRYAGSHRPDATFRIRYGQPRADGTYGYTYYDAAGLWRWARSSRRDPKNNPWFYEDWMQLRNRYEPDFQIPNWVDALPRLGSEGQVYETRRLPMGGLAYYDTTYEPERHIKTEFVNHTYYYRHLPETGIDVLDRIVYEDEFVPVGSQPAELPGSTQYFRMRYGDPQLERWTSNLWKMPN